MNETDGPRPAGWRPRLHAVEEVERSPSPAAKRFLWIFSVCMVLVAGSGFIFKLIEFVATATTRGSDALASFLIPVLNYLLVAAGFFCLFLWAYCRGQFRDLEEAKYRMLELCAEADRLEAGAASGSPGSTRSPSPQGGARR